MKSNDRLKELLSILIFDKKMMPQQVSADYMTDYDS